MKHLESNVARCEHTLKLLLDEMYTGLKEYFETLGWDVITLQDAGLKGTKDRKVIEYAENNNLVVVTQDQKPADLADLKGVPYVLISMKMIAKMADAQIREKYPHAKQ
jgi:predicted nuclease of predicted toxin-antitoxin system